MKKNRVRAAVIALCLGISLSFSSCQPSPDKEVVVGKDQLEELIANTLEGTTAAESEAGGSTPSVPAAIKESTYQNTYTPEENLRFLVDATVKTYDSAMPVLRAKPHEFTSEEVRSLAEYFFQGQTAYETRSVMTKESIEQRILDLTKWANDTEGLLACANNEEEAARAKEMYEEEIRIWKERYETAPEEYQPKECDWQFHPASYFDETLAVSDQLYPDICETDKNYYIKASATLDGKTYNIEAMNRTADSYLGHSFSFGISWDDQVWMTGGSSGTEEEAQVLADQLLENLGIRDRWTPQSCAKNEYGSNDGSVKPGYMFQVTYLPVYEGFSLSNLPYPSMNWQEEHYAPFYNYESLEITISNGEIRHLSWSSPLDIVSVENAAVTELSFDQIMERFGEQMEVTYPLSSFEWDECLKAKEAEFRISGIERRMARILIPEATMEYYLIPAWSFYGVNAVRYNDDPELSFDSYWEDEDGNRIKMTRPPEHILSLNALDGSVIDTVQGY